MLFLLKKVHTGPLSILDGLKTIIDAAGGMGRHLGVFSCTMLMYVFSLFFIAKLNVVLVLAVS